MIKREKWAEEVNINRKKYIKLTCEEMLNLHDGYAHKDQNVTFYTLLPGKNNSKKIAGGKDDMGSLGDHIHCQRYKLIQSLWTTNWYYKFIILNLAIPSLYMRNSHTRAHVSQIIFIIEKQTRNKCVHVLGNS